MPPDNEEILREYERRINQVIDYIVTHLVFTAKAQRRTLFL